MEAVLDGRDLNLGGQSSDSHRLEEVLRFHQQVAQVISDRSVIMSLLKYKGYNYWEDQLKPFLSQILEILAKIPSSPEISVSNAEIIPNPDIASESRIAIQTDVSSQLEQSSRSDSFSVVESGSEGSISLAKSTSDGWSSISLTHASSNDTNSHLDASSFSKKGNSQGLTQAVHRECLPSNSDKIRQKDPISKGFVFDFKLQTNPKLIINQMRFARVLLGQEGVFLMLHSAYFSKEELLAVEHEILQNDKFGLSEFQKGKSVLVAAKMAEDGRKSVIVYGYSLETPGQRVVQAESLILHQFGTGENPTEQLCYLTCVTNPDDLARPIMVQLLNASSKKSRVLANLKSVMNPAATYLKCVMLNCGKDVLMVVKIEPTKLKICLAPADVSVFHKYVAKALSINFSDGTDKITDVLDFHLDCQANLDEAIKRFVNLPEDGQDNVSYAMAEGAKLFLSCLVSISGSYFDQYYNIPWESYRIMLSRFKFESSDQRIDAHTIYSEPAEPLIELPPLGEISEKILTKLHFQGTISSLIASRVRFCSDWNTAFLFGHGTAANDSTSLSFVVVLSLPTTATTTTDSSSKGFELQTVVRSTSALRFDGQSLEQTPVDRETDDKLMPPVVSAFMIAENPGLRRPTGVMTTGPQKHPLFIAGIQNDDTIFSVYLDDPTGAKTLRVENARDYFEKESPDKNVVNKKYHHVTSISWAETPHGDKFTMAANRFSVITFGLNSSQGTLNV